MCHLVLSGDTGQGRGRSSHRQVITRATTHALQGHVRCCPTRRYVHAVTHLSGQNPVISRGARV